MLFVHVVERELSDKLARACSDVLVEWAVAQARAVGAARGLDVQQIDTGAYEDDERQHRFLRDNGFEKVRTWWQMNRPVEPGEADLVESPDVWEDRGVRFRKVRRAGTGLPDEDDLRDVHDVLEQAFVDHFNSWEETFDEFVFRVREDPGHRWDHWWLAEVVDGRVEGRRATTVCPPVPWWARCRRVAPGRTAPTCRTSASSRPPAAGASPRVCCARSSPTPPRVA